MSGSPRSINFLLLIALLLSSCASRYTLEPPPVPSAAPTASPSETPVPTQTQTPTRLPQPSRTATLPPTPTPTRANSPAPTTTLVETALPGPAALSGTIILAGDGKKPWATTVELHHPETFALAAQVKSGPDGKYAVKDLLSGAYDLWVLITDKPGPVGICSDVVPEGEDWQIGIRFGKDKGMTIEGASLSKAQLLAQNLQDPTLKAEGFYAVLPGLRLEPVKENVLEITLQCR